MGVVERHLRNATSSASLFHQLSDLWRKPRGTVLRIEALALLAIVLSFFLATLGSCRRWSNRWIVQKGFLGAQVLSLSLGTYSIGLMQSSPVKSDMYPIWAVSLFTLFGCVDPVTTYVGLDYKGPLLKVISQLCLYCGYILLMSIPTISGVAGNLAIGVLSAVTFIKGFHRAMALVLPTMTRDFIEERVSNKETGALAGVDEDRLNVHLPWYLEGMPVDDPEFRDFTDGPTMADIHKHMGELRLPEVTANGLTIEGVCLGYSLSHLLQRRFLGLSGSKEMEIKRKVLASLVGDDGRVGIDYVQTLKVVEVELAFLYEIYFSSNEFLHLYQAKTGTVWALATLMGICFVGVALAIPGAMTTSSITTTSDTTVVATRTADLVVTLVILASLAVLQLVQLIRCWTSNWAKVAFACDYVRHHDRNRLSKSWWHWVRLKAFAITRTMNWFDNKYLWQDSLGQYPLVDVVLSGKCERLRTCCTFPFEACTRTSIRTGAAYMVPVLSDLVLDSTSRVATVGLGGDVKASIAEFLCRVRSARIGEEWSSLFVDNGIDASYLPFSRAPLMVERYEMVALPEAYAFTYRVMVWHIATRYCELADDPLRSQSNLYYPHLDFL